MRLFLFLCIYSQTNANFLENPNFREQFPNVKIGFSKTPVFENLSMSITLYLDKKWMSAKMPSFDPFIEAFETVKYSNNVFSHHSLNVKIQLSVWSLKRSPYHLDPTEEGFRRFQNLIRESDVGKSLPKDHRCHVYLTLESGTEDSGLGIFDSTCDKNRSVPAVMVEWGGSAEETGITLAHEIAHNLGVRCVYCKLNYHVWSLTPC